MTIAATSQAAWHNGAKQAQRGDRHAIVEQLTINSLTDANGLTGLTAPELAVRLGKFPSDIGTAIGTLVKSGCIRVSGLRAPHKKSCKLYLLVDASLVDVVPPKPRRPRAVVTPVLTPDEQFHAAARTLLENYRQRGFDVVGLALVLRDEQGGECLDRFADEDISA